MKNLLRGHYFLWFGSLSGVLPYTSIFAKEHVQASASEIGLLYTLLPFVAFFTKPIVCGIADRFNGHKLTLVVVMIATLTGFGFLLFTPWFPTGHWSWWYFCGCVMLANTAMGVGTTLTDSIVMREVTNGGSSYGSIRLWGTVGWGIFGLVAGGINDNIFIGLPYLLPGLIMFIVIICINIILITVRFKKEQERSKAGNVDIGVGEMIQEERKCSRNNVPSSKELTNVAVQEYGLGTNSTTRIGSMGHCGHGSNCGGTNCLRRKSFAKGILRTFLQNPSLFHFCFIIFVVGFLSAFHWTFFFWFIEEIHGKDTLLMGLALVVQSFLGEIPFFLISEKILNKIGPSHCLTLTLLAFAIRFLSYGFLINSTNAYFVLVVELTQGPTFSLFYVVMTRLAQDYSLKSTIHGSSSSNSSNVAVAYHDPSSNAFDRNFASDQIPNNAAGNSDPPIFVTTGLTLNEAKSVPDLECSGQGMNQEGEVYASMQGIMSGLYEGAGLGVGSLVAGFLIEKRSIVETWQLAGFISLIVAAMNLLLDFNIEKCK